MAPGEAPWLETGPKPKSPLFPGALLTVLLPGSGITRVAGRFGGPANAAVLLIVLLHAPVSVACIQAGTASLPDWLISVRPRLPSLAAVAVRLRLMPLVGMSAAGMSAAGMSAAGGIPAPLAVADWARTGS